MLEAALRDGHDDRTCVFQVFCRSLPPGRRFAISAGLGRLLPLLTELRFDEDDLAFLWRNSVVSAETTDWLRSFAFSGDVWAYPEGELLLPGSPVLQVIGSFAEATLLETLVLSVLNHDTAIASAAARMRLAAGDRSLLEFGSRRTHEEAAVAAARAAWLAGFDGSSNLAAGARFGVPTLGTAAHSWTLLHDDETEAFVAQVASDGAATTLLVDTYDTERGVVRAVDAAGTELGHVRRGHAHGAHLGRGEGGDQGQGDEQCWSEADDESVVHGISVSLRAPRRGPPQRSVRNDRLASPPSVRTTQRGCTWLQNVPRRLARPGTRITSPRMQAS
jgi:nicotinate phosphoribosyltransferase